MYHADLGMSRSFIQLVFYCVTPRPTQPSREKGSGAFSTPFLDSRWRGNDIEGVELSINLSLG
jgi:hypothetical protein